MTIKEKILEKERSVKDLIIELKDILNKSSIYNKTQPLDYKYLSSLSTTNEKLEELNSILKEINN